ncbi:MAG: large conductance mechanosensitive channel protein MscL [Christensenellaceae bacterium]|jgi:large conductance mechanosensitive channel|nr:large conductance mechanosensitive channel protein MscL [Christensenellaceae bacterium]
MEKKKQDKNGFLKKGTGKLHSFGSDFKKFITRGNVLDLAVAVIMGTAFGKIVSSLVSDIVMPLILGIFGKNDITTLSFFVNGSEVHYGIFLQSIIDFLLIAFFVFLMIRMLMKLQHGFGESKKITQLIISGKLKKRLKNKNVHLKKSGYVGKFFKEKPTPAKLSTEDLLAQILEELKKKNAS